MKNVLLKIASLCMILVILGSYNSVTAVRDRDEQIAKLEADMAVMEMGGGSESGGGFQDGTYTGSAQGYGGTITVEVVIKDGSIAQINPVSYAGEDAAYWKMALAVIPQLVDSQGTRADTVSGATFSSAGIINGTLEALNQAL